MKNYTPYSMFVDDERFPPIGATTVIVRSTEEAKQVMNQHGCPEFVSFDHDLGGSDEAINLVHWMIQQDLDHREYGFIFIPTDFTFYVHSQNPIGAKNISELLNSYLSFRNSENGNLCV